MAWIKMNHELWSDPKVEEIADRLGQPVPMVIGALHGVWCIADLHAVDGVLEMTTEARLDRRVGIPGFAEAMRAVGWLDGEDGELVLPEYEEHNGPTAKRRAQAQKRVERNRSRERKPDRPRRKAPTRKAEPADDAVAFDSETGKQAAADEPPTKVDGSADPRRFPNNWCAEIRREYPEHRLGGPRTDYDAIREALDRIEATQGSPQKAVAFLKAKVRKFAASPAGKAGKHVPSLQRWMREDRYEQPETAWQVGDDHDDKPNAPPASAAYHREPTDEEKRIEKMRRDAARKRQQTKGAK